jgi:hypothetical protein
VPSASAPALHTDYSIAVVENAKFDGFQNSPLQTTVHIFLPRHFVEIWLLFVEYEGIDSSVKVRVLKIVVRISIPKENNVYITYSSCSCIASDHDDRTYRSVFRYESSCVATEFRLD